MDIEIFREYCLALKGTTESLPFGPDTLVFKVGGKMFALCNIDNFEFINLKCDPDRAIDLRERYDGIKPGYHMNKVYWNSVYTNLDIADDLIRELTDHSYDLVFSGLSKKAQSEIRK